MYFKVHDTHLCDLNLLSRTEIEQNEITNSLLVADLLTSLPF
jgi:hypothetical protein